MSKTTKTCVEFECDGCGEGWADSDYGTPHFEITTDPTPETMQGAVDELVKSWNWTAVDDEHYCHLCSAERLCEAKGHVWGPWVDRPDFLDPDWRDKPAQHEQRFCDREYCHGREERAR